MAENRINNYSRPLVAFAACMGCAFFGVTMFFWGAMLPVVRESIAGADNFPWVLTLGIIAGTLICGTVMDRYGYKWLLILSAASLAIGLAGFIYCTTSTALYLSTFLIGAGGGVLNSETIAIISDIYGDDKRGAMLSILGASYCVGSLLWTILCRVLVNDYTLPMKTSAAVIAFLSFCFVFIKFPKAKLSKDEGSSILKSFTLLKYPLLVAVCSMLFFQGILEAISANYSTSYYVNSENGIGLNMALTALIFMTVGMAVGRFTLPLCMKIGGNKISLYLFMAIAFAGALIQYLMPGSILGAFLSMTFIGFGTGVTAPVVFSYLGEVFKKYSGIAVSLAVVVAQIGMLLGNFLVGKLFMPERLERGTFHIFPIIMCIVIILVVMHLSGVAKLTSKTKEKKLDL
ncbi:MAG: MFS transporter [Bacteroidales bacterium]|nr:MFS transporter [Bacteroidales bacterium]